MHNIHVGYYALYKQFNDKEWTSIINLLDEQVKLDNRLEKDLQALVQEAARINEASSSSKPKIERYHLKYVS
jgi:uncharacterized protein (DUF1778 family)